MGFAKFMKDVGHKIGHEFKKDVHKVDKALHLKQSIHALKKDAKYLGKALTKLPKSKIYREANKFVKKAVKSMCHNATSGVLKDIITKTAGAIAGVAAAGAVEAGTGGAGTGVMLVASTASAAATERAANSIVNKIAGKCK